MSHHSLQHLSPNVKQLQHKLELFVKNECIPAEKEYEEHMLHRSGKDRWTLDAIPPCIERLQLEAKRQGLWNLFLPHRLPSHLLLQKNNNPFSSSSSSLEPSIYLTNREYGILCETMGKSPTIAPSVCNCSAPDTGNMEVLLKFGTQQQQALYLKPLLEGKIRSCFLMTEPDVASSDATNMQTSLLKYVDHEDGGKIKYVLNGKKWWSSGAMDPRCKVALVLAKMDYSHESLKGLKGLQGSKDGKNGRHGGHTIVVVPMSKVKLIRPLTVFGYDHAPHGHAQVQLTNIHLDETNLILGEGKGFEISQARLGPGRIHHCMRAIGIAARAHELMVRRSLERETFGQALWKHGGCQEMIAESFSDLEAARLLTLSCADAIDTYGAQGARDSIASIKYAVPKLTHAVIDRSLQVHGGAGVCSDFPLAEAYANIRTLRIADGPDAVHKRTVAMVEVKRAKKRLEREKLAEKDGSSKQKSRM